ncbi:MAG: hypothetical protein CM15mP83_6800 [Flavobacteriaceae bacterium]|nr:MAG: hypothetical protein CM15mP83_6800 [Flavobacteriaceae bacterium]
MMVTLVGAGADGVRLWRYSTWLGVASNTNAQDWTHIYYDSTPLDLSSGDRRFRFKIRGPRTESIFKLQVGGEYWNNHEWPAAEANYTTPGEWQTILVDASCIPQTTRLE